LSSYTYHLCKTYGSEEIDTKEVEITEVKVAKDKMSVELICKNLRPGYVHELNAHGVWSTDRAALLHPHAYYTLNRIPKK
jgi:hypothetical protein